MSKRVIIPAVVVAALLVGGWSLAQQAQAPKQTDPGRFMVSPAGKSAVLLETTTGKTWLLAESADGDAVWLPLERLNSRDQFLEWRERELKRKLIEREREIERAKERLQAAPRGG